MSWLNQQQVSAISRDVRLATALHGGLTGEEFERIIERRFPNSTACGDKKWFDIIQPNRGLEVKTFQTGKSDIIAPGSSIDNVLKRIPLEALDKKLVNKNGTLDTTANLNEIGASIIDYLHSSMRKHAGEKGIKGAYTMVVLLRNGDKKKKINTNSLGYWEQTLNFGSGSDYRWSWSESGKGIVGHIGNRKVLTWYWQNQKQLFYNFRAPANVQVFSITPGKAVSYLEEELEKLLSDTYQKGFEDGKKN